MITQTCQETADKIIAAYKEHYDFPWQGESHMHDCIVVAIEGTFAHRDELLAVLKEIADGCVAYRPGHVNYSDNRTKEEIRVIADAAIARATS